MSNDPNIDPDEYRAKYNNVCSQLMTTAIELQGDLEVIDITGGLFAVGIESARRAGMPDEEIVGWLRELADALENGSVGFRKRIN